MEDPKEVIRVWVVCFDLLGDNGGVREVRGSIGEVTLNFLTSLNGDYFRGG